MIIGSIDPGERWAGAVLLSATPDGGHQCDCRDCSADGRVRLLEAYEFDLSVDPDGPAEWLRIRAWMMHRFVLERFQLYPWMARQQGFSTFGTAEQIGILKYLARRADLPVVMQDAAKNLKDGRTLAQTHGFTMEDRKMGSGKFAYWGPDFKLLPGRPHRRDAASHGVLYAYNHEHEWPLS